MKNRVLSILLVCVLLLGAAVPAFAQNSAPETVVGFGRFYLYAPVQAPMDAKDDRVVYFILDEAYTEPAESCHLLVDYVTGYNEDGSPMVQTQSLTLADLHVRAVPYEENGKQSTRLLCWFPESRDCAPDRVEIAAGSFLRADGGICPAVTLDDFPFVYLDNPFSRESKVLEETDTLTSYTPVGAQDALVLNAVIPVPVSICYDGQTLGERAAMQPGELRFLAGDAGTHTVEVRFEDYPLYQLTFDVKTQKQVYSSTMRNLWDEIKYYPLLPLAAPLAMVIAPPAGIAAALSPLLAGELISSFLRYAFRIFNLLKH